MEIIRIFRPPAVFISAVLAVVALSPSRALASDYSQLVYEALLFLVAVGGIGLVLGAMTSAIAARAWRRKWVWWLCPGFAVFWAAVIIGLFNLWGEVESSQAPPEVPVAAPRGPDTDPLPQR